MVVMDSVKDGSRSGFLGRRDLSLRLFLKDGAEGGMPVFGPQSRVVVYPLGNDSLEIWLTPDLYDAGFRMRGRRGSESWEGIVCEDSFSHRCNRRGTFQLSPKT